MCFPRKSYVKDIYMLLIIVSILIMVGIVAFDQITKLLVVANIPLHTSVEVIPNIFRFTYIKNDGAAFGMLDNARWVFMVFSCVAIVGVLAYLFIKKPQSKLLCISLAFVVGGGIGNMIDRFRLGYVIDFLDFCAFPKLWMWTFNVADSFVVIGAGMLMLWMVLDLIREIKEEKAQKLAQSMQSEENTEENNND